MSLPVAQWSSIWTSNQRVIGSHSDLFFQATCVIDLKKSSFPKKNTPKLRLNEWVYLNHNVLRTLTAIRMKISCIFLDSDAHLDVHKSECLKMLYLLPHIAVTCWRELTLYGSFHGSIKMRWCEIHLMCNVFVLFVCFTTGDPMHQQSQLLRLQYLVGHLCPQDLKCQRCLCSS